MTRRGLTAVVAICLLLEPSHARRSDAQIVEVALAGLAGALIGDVIGKFEDMAFRMLNQGQSTGDALLTTAGNQLRVDTENARLAFADQQWSGIRSRFRGTVQNAP